MKSKLMLALSEQTNFKDALAKANARKPVVKKFKQDRASKLADTLKGKADVAPAPLLKEINDRHSQRNQTLLNVQRAIASMTTNAKGNKFKAPRAEWEKAREGKTGHAYKAAIDSTIASLYAQGFFDHEIAWILFDGPHSDYHNANPDTVALANYVEKVTSKLKGAI